MKYTLRDESFVDIERQFYSIKAPCHDINNFSSKWNITTASKRYDFWHNVYKIQ